ncbi:autotransporter outer membrane beta-barrel domain-containing protein [Caballeronia sordidicola]|uniref:autotransporter outer membrane beta-barrel domain-containing protein n=3 Tax=Caballeronia sordidicola TaxID=196367 RepID=UPI00211702C7|nr:autotransporter outer membrane beta-barrel domain-containing protein [Caballeronia sordidicola]
MSTGAHSRVSATWLAVLANIALLPLPVFANCTASGTATSCDTSAPSPWQTTIGTGPTAATGSSVLVGPNAQVILGDATAIALADNANITVQSGALVQNSARTSGGTYGTGGNTIDFRNNGTLTVQQGGSVISAGTQGSAEAANPEGAGNTIVNNGTIRGINSAAIWFQNTSGLNTVINNATGVIQAPSNVIGSSGNGAVDFTNRGQVIGNLIFAGGNDTLRLYTGSSISGNFNGGGGNNTIFLSGEGTATLPGNMVNFSSLIKNDTGFWTLSGTVTGVTIADVQQGTLALTGNNTNYTGKVLVEPAGILQARAQSLPPGVTDNGLVRFAQPDDGTYAGSLSGTGAVEKTGAGVLTLAPAVAGGNTYSGGTTITQGTVAIGADNALGAANGGITFNGGTLRFNQSVDLAGTRPVSINAPGGTIDTQGFSSTVAQGISGPGALTKAGSGTLAMTGANTYAGGTTIAAGTLQLGAGGTSGSIEGDVIDNGSLVFNRSDAATFSGAISGTGSVGQAGAGATTLTANNTYTGGTTIAAGTLQLGDGGTSGSIVGDVNNNGSLVFNRSDATTFSGAVSGAGSVTQAGAGTTTLTSSNTYTGGTTIAAGTLQLGNGGTSGSIVGDVNDNGTLVFNRSDATTFSGAVSGTGSLAQAGTGTTTLTANNTYTGGTTIAAGTLQLGDGGTSGSILGDVNDNGSLVFNRSDAMTFPGAISGTGSVTQAGAGTTTLTANNTYTGGTAIAAGTLQLGDGGTSGGIVGDVANNGSLVFNRSDAVAFAGAISGTGSVTQAGPGTTLFTADNPYSGGTTVAAGTLAVGDAQHLGAALSGDGSVNVASAGTLGGYGSVTGNVTNNGTIAVADALPAFASSGNGAFTINGTFTNAGLAAVGGAAVGNRLNVTGNYIGANGTIALNTVVAGDNAASDRLVISGPASTATGTSALKINNVGGAGAGTLANGIQVIEANNGATTDLSAFRLASPVKAGAYSYYLAKGGVSDGTAQNWYLRNTIAPAPVAPAPPTTPAPPGTPAPPSTAPLPVNPSLPVSAANPLAPADTPIAAPGTPPTLLAALSQAAATPATAAAPAAPVYRPEAPVYAAIPMVARQIGIEQIGTFHDRQGEQSLLDESGTLPAAWGRVWGGHTTQSQDGALNPEFSGSIYGAQAGHDIYADSTPGGHRNHYGFFVGFTRATGDVNGYALATPNLDVGHLAVNGYSLGGYWTHIGPGGWYTDAVLMGTSLTIDPMSHDGVGVSTHGHALSGSLEAGLPIPIAYGLEVEPQAQIIWQNLSINDLNDGVSTVSFKHGNTFLGRLGVRLQGTYTNAIATWQPYLRVSVLRNFGAGDDVSFAGTTTLPGSVGQTAGQVGAGLVTKVSKSASAYATLSYLTNLGGSHQRTIEGNAGVRWSW